MCETYNGWSNRETWAVMLHLNNDEGLQSIAEDYARTCLEEHEEERSVAVDCLAESLETFVFTLVNARAYREEFGAEQPAALADMGADIGSLYRVDWRECAEALAGSYDATVTA